MDPNMTISFTDHSWELFYGVIEEDAFQNNEAAAIYQALEKKLHYIPFGDYLKRFVFRAAGLEGNFSDVPDEEYQQIIVDSFRENGVPASFGPSTVRISMQVKNWLRQRTVRRSAVLQLGFGLRMTQEEVNEFLIKAIHEQELNESDPFELLCAFCYRRGCRYSQLERLYEAMLRPPQERGEITDPDEKEVLARCDALSSCPGVSEMEETAGKVYRELYREAQELIAGMYETTGYFAGCRAEDITESDLEHVLSSAIPTDRHGNLVPAARSNLGSEFAERRITRQHVHSLLHGKVKITRYDILTLLFFLWSQKNEYADRPKRRFISYIDTANELLSQCRFGEIYVANPYESFLLMCLLTEVPLSTYADIWEMAHRSAGRDPS